MITKEDAMSCLRELIDSAILSESIADDLNDIAICIEQLENGLDLFGADDDCGDLFIAKMNPYNSSAPYNTDELKKEYDEWISHCEQLAEKYKIKA